MFGTWDTDRDPLDALRAGDRAPFEAFVRGAAPAFLGFFRRLGADEDEAEDLVQEVFLKLYQCSRTYRPTGRFGAFAFRIARNAWIDRRRRGAVQPRAAGGDTDVGDADVDAGTRRQGESAHGYRRERAAPAPTVPLDDTPHGAAELREEAERVRAALARLPEHHRLVFELGVVQELPYSEIGALLEIPEGTVKSRMFHAVRRLRELLGVRTG